MTEPSPAEEGKSPKAEFVSIVIPCRNERKYIGPCLDSILAGDYPADRFEILVADGRSEDGTREIVEDYARRHRSLRLVDNPKRITPAGLNAAIAASRGGAILWMSAHNRYPPDYVRRCVAALRASGADNVGGAIRTVPREDTPTGRAIVAALSHPFGVGGSRFRTGVTEATPADTVFGGCYRRDVFDRIGGFNERLVRGQDMEFNLRLRRAGGRILLIPGVVSTYYARSDWASFWRHNLSNGEWAVLPFLHSDVVPVAPRHLAPLAFVLTLAGLSVVTPFLPAAGGGLAVTAGAYAAAGLAAAAHAAVRAGEPGLFLRIAAAFTALHLAYGIGSLRGLCRMVAAPAPAPEPGRRIRSRPEDDLKRLMDAASAGAGLFALGPVFLLIAAGIKFSSPGPVFYRGVRAGRGGRPFRIFKFRTMVVDADRIGGPSTADDDPRITSIGRFLRKRKLDELPQLLNVLIGDMSLVGPRPEVIPYIDLLGPGERDILSVRPGITDWASLWNPDEGAVLAGSPDPERAYLEKIRPRKIRLQLEYVRKRSLRVDLDILVNTLRLVLGRGLVLREGRRLVRDLDWALVGSGTGMRNR